MLNTYICSYGDSVVLVASQEVRERALFPAYKESFHEMSLIQYCILEAIGSSRHIGILRTDLTKQYLRIDPRSTYHHCKVLETAGLLSVTVRYSVCVCVCVCVCVRVSQSTGKQKGYS